MSERQLPAPANDKKIEPFAVTIRGKEIPLYSSGLGRALARAGASTIPYGIDLIRILKNLSGEMVGLSTDQPVVVYANANHRVDLIVPVTQLGDWPGLSVRSSRVVDEFIETGRFSSLLKPERRLPPGRKVEGGEKMTVARDILKTRNLRQSLMNFLEEGSPLAVLSIGIDEMQRHRLKKRMKSERSSKKKQVDEISPLLGDPQVSSIHMDINLACVVPGRTDMLTRKFRFTLGEIPLEFDESGEVKGSPWFVMTKERRIVYYHPALMGMQDMAAVMTARIAQETGRKATISSDVIATSIDMAKDKMPNILAPLYRRMEFIDIINERLGQDPSLVLEAIFKTIKFVTSDGEDHPDDSEMREEIGRAVIGGPNAPESQRSVALSYPLLVFQIERVCNKHDSMVQWSVSRQILEEILDKAGELTELKAIGGEYVGRDVEGLLEEVKPYSPLILFTDISTPETIIMAMQAIIVRRNTFRHLNMQRHKRTVTGARQIVRMSDNLTDKGEEFWEGMGDEFSGQIKELPAEGRRLGRRAGKKVLGEYKQRGGDGDNVVPGGTRRLSSPRDEGDSEE